MDDDLLGGLDGAGALRSGGVLARQCGAGLSGCALAGAGPCGGGPRPLGRVVALGGEGPAAAGGGADGETGEDTYCHGRGFSLSESGRARLCAGQFFLLVKWLCAPRGPEVGRGVSTPPSLPLDSTLPATS